MPGPEDPRSRYAVESVMFDRDMESITIDFQDPAHQGPIVLERTQWLVNLQGDDELQTVAFALYDSVCDLIDRAFAANRAVRRDARG